MSRKELEAQVEYLKELEGLMDEIKAEAETIKDQIKAEMLDRQVNELQAGRYIVRWTDVVSNKFDSAAFKKLYGELYKAFTKPVSSKRFSVC